MDSVDPTFLASVSRSGGVSHVAFLTLVVLNLVGGFNALGTLLAVGLMMLPAAVRPLLRARFLSAPGHRHGDRLPERAHRPARVLQLRHALGPVHRPRRDRLWRRRRVRTRGWGAVALCCPDAI